MSSKQIRVGIIGAGGNTKLHHIPKLQSQPGVEVVSVANRTPASARKVAKLFSIEKVADTWQDVIDDEYIDAVCIGTWPYMHSTLTIAALEAGKHVLCEARMACDANEAKAMLDVSRACPSLVAQIVPAPHTLAFDRTIVDMVADGKIGELVTLDAQIAMGSSFPDHSAPLHWRHERKYSGNNVMSMGIWYEAIMRWIGPAASVQALGQCVVRHRLDDQGRRTAMSIPDHIDVLCSMQQGGQMRLMVSTVVGHAPGVVLHIFGTEGTLRLAGTGPGDMALSYGSRRDKALKPVKVPKAKQGAWRVEEEFINAIRGKEPVTHTDLATGLQYMEFTDAVTASLNSGGQAVSV